MLIHKRIMELISGVLRYMLLKSGLSLLVSATYIVQAVFLGRLITQLFYKADSAGIRLNLIIISVMLVLRIGLIWLNQVYGKWIVGRVKNRLRERCYEKLTKLGPAFLTRGRTGRIESAIVAGVDYLEGYLTLYIPQILVCVIGSGAMTIYIFTIHPLLGGIVLVTALAALFAPVLFLNVISRFTEDHWDAYQDLNAEFVDTVQGMMTLKALNASGRVGRAIKQKMHVLFNKTMASLKVNLAEVGVSGFATGLGSAFTLGIAAWFTARGTLTVAELSVLLFLTTEVYRPVSELGLYFHQGFMGMTSTDGIIELLDTPLFTEDRGDKVPAFQGAPEVDFEGIRFAYPGSDRPVFEQLNLRVKPGEKLALVGESGSGKTTLINLLTRFYDPAEGVVRLNGEDIRRFALRALRREVAIVSQDTYLFNGSIAENLRLAAPDADMAALENACRAARIHEDIVRMPEGYDTLLGERGMNLSGGQRQRLAIARALLKKASLIILDEATSSVDEGNEKAIQAALETLLADKTCLTIAHRLSTVQAADRIVVMRRGKIVEEGTHHSLLEQDGYYARLVSARKEDSEHEATA